MGVPPPHPFDKRPGRCDNTFRHHPQSFVSGVIAMTRWILQVSGGFILFSAVKVKQGAGLFYLQGTHNLRTLSTGAQSTPPSLSTMGCQNATPSLTLFEKSDSIRPGMLRQIACPAGSMSHLLPPCRPSERGIFLPPPKNSLPGHGLAASRQQSGFNLDTKLLSTRNSTKPKALQPFSLPSVSLSV